MVRAWLRIISDYDIFTSFHGDSSDLYLVRKFSEGDVRSYGLCTTKFYFCYISNLRSCYFAHFILKNLHWLVMFIDCLHVYVLLKYVMCWYELFIFNSVILCEVLCKLIRVNWRQTRMLLKVYDIFTSFQGNSSA